MKTVAFKKEQVKKDIIYRILSGQYPLAGRIPPERTLCKITKTSRMTVRAAIDDLIKEDILKRNGRHGTLIKKMPDNEVCNTNRPKRILFIYFSSIKGNLVEQIGGSAKLYNGVEHFANEYNYGLQIQSGENFIQQKYHEAIDGIVVGGSQLDQWLPEIMKLKVPVVLMDVFSYIYPVNAVSGDHYEAGIKAGQKVIAQKYRKPLLLTVQYDDENFIQPSFCARQRGVVDFTSEHGLEVYKHVVNYRDIQNNGKSVEALCKLIKDKNIDSIIDCSDLTNTYLSDIEQIYRLPTIIIGGVGKNYNKRENVELLYFDMERIGYLAAQRLDTLIKNPCIEPIRYLLPVKDKTVQKSKEV